MDGHGARGRGHEATVASSSGRSNYSFGVTTTTGTEPTSTSHRSSKRKRGLDTEDSESPSEDAESESLVLERKPPQKLTTARRSRAAEVHNLSERVRCVINFFLCDQWSIVHSDQKKNGQLFITTSLALTLAVAEETRQDQREDASPARAHTPLQQGTDSARHSMFLVLIGSIGFFHFIFVMGGMQTDKASMLDEIIDYVKFLQLQVKVLATDEFWPAQGGTAPEISQVKEALDAILSSQRGN